MGRKARDEAERTRARILASALSLFAKKGYGKTSFATIAARLGLTKGAVYWHFESKEALLVAILDEMLKKFRAGVLAILPEGEEGYASLTFRAVADMMVRNASLVLEDATAKSFFLLVHEQLRWSDASMARVKENLLLNPRFGPWAAFRKAVENDIAAGKVRRGVDPVQVATVCVSVWNGMVHARIAKVLMCDLEDTLKKTYAAVWKSISAKRAAGGI